MADFKDYLTSKKIDPLAFEKASPKIFKDWEKEFECMHPKSFEARKMFYLNNIRREFPIKIESKTDNENKAPRAKFRPVIKPKI